MHNYGTWTIRILAYSDLLRTSAVVNSDLGLFGPWLIRISTTGQFGPRKIEVGIDHWFWGNMVRISQGPNRFRVRISQCPNRFRVWISQWQNLFKVRFDQMWNIRSESANAWINSRSTLAKMEASSVSLTQIWRMDSPFINPFVNEIPLSVMRRLI